MDEEDEDEDEEEEELLPPLTTIKEVKAAFEEFLSRVPEPMVTKLHKLIREREGAADQGQEEEGEGESENLSEEDQSLMKGDELIFSIREELRKRLPVSAQAPNEEFFFNQSSGVFVLARLLCCI